MNNLTDSQVAYLRKWYKAFAGLGDDNMLIEINAWLDSAKAILDSKPKSEFQMMKEFRT